MVAATILPERRVAGKVGLSVDDAGDVKREIGATLHGIRIIFHVRTYFTFMFDIDRYL
jgi:hypothetical protein